MKFVELDPGMVFVPVASSKNSVYIVFVTNVDATYAHYDVFENDHGKIRWNLNGKMDSETWDKAMMSSLVRPSKLESSQHRKIIQGIMG